MTTARSPCRLPIREVQASRSWNPNSNPQRRRSLPTSKNNAALRPGDPTEIRATLAAAKTVGNRRVVAVFQPHRYSRTRDLADDFAGAFEQADVVFVTDIYPAGEPEMPGISGKLIAEKIQSSGHPSVHWVNGMPNLSDCVREKLAEGDIVITLGAGDIWKVGEQLLAELPSSQSR